MGPKIYEEPEDCNIYFAIVCTYKDHETWVLRAAQVFSPTFFALPTYISRLD